MAERAVHRPDSSITRPLRRAQRSHVRGIGPYRAGGRTGSPQVQTRPDTTCERMKCAYSLLNTRRLGVQQRAIGGLFEQPTIAGAEELATRIRELASQARDVLALYVDFNAVGADTDAWGRLRE